MSGFRVGLLGAGFIADAHAAALQSIPGASLVAVCDKSPGRAEAFASRHGITEAFSDLDRFLSARLDAVHVLLPPDMHVPMATRVVEAGTAVLLEKPMGTSVVECRALADLSRQKAVPVGVSHNFLFMPAYVRLRQDLRSGVLGKIDHLTIHWEYPLGFINHGPFDNWIVRQTTNSFLETAPHLLAFAVDLLGSVEDVKAVAMDATVTPSGVKVYRKWAVTARSGSTLISVNLSMTDGPTDRTLYLRCRGGMAVCAFDRDVYVKREHRHTNPVFDNVLMALDEGRQYLRTGISNFVRAVGGTLRRTPKASPFSESFLHSVQAFYAGLAAKRLDERLDVEFAVRVMRSCADVITAANVVNSPAPDLNGFTKAPLTSAPDVLVIGGAGFIGRHLVDQLTRKGRSVRVASRSRLAAAVGLRGLPVEIVEGSLSDPDYLKRIMQGITVVYHLAKCEGKRWADYVANEINVTRLIADTAMAQGVSRFIYTGTIASYYSASATDVIDNTTPVDPQIDTRSHYPRSKAVSEAYLMQLHKDKGFPAIIFRPGVVIGPGCPPAHWGVGAFASEAAVSYWGDGYNKLPFILVQDVASALVLALDTPGIEGRAFLLTDTPLMSAREYCEEVSKISGMRLHAQSRAIASYYFEEATKELFKFLTRHPNRRIPSYRDVACSAHKARFDSSDTERTLNWHPVGTREGMIEKGIRPAVEEAFG